MRVFIIVLTCLLSFTLPAYSQATNIACSNNTNRSWWDVQHYDLNLNIDTATGRLDGYVVIHAKRTKPAGTSLQLDLQEPLHINYVIAEHEDGTVDSLQYTRTDAHYIVSGNFASILRNGNFSLKVGYEGTPRIAARAPWDGGLVKDRDDAGNRWMGMACQGTGASVWFPCKDFQGDEADSGMRISMVVPANLMMIANGRLQPNNERRGDGNLRWTWQVTNPINNYDITFYIGDYIQWSDTLQGAKGKLSLDFFALRQHETQARSQFKVVKPMLQCFEQKMGPYPFYEDGYKLVEAPYLGMEHQSAVAYGNGFKMGYHGEDRSKSGVGLLFDFIIVHESGHEWFGNSITAYDKADSWIHEGFTSYTETVFAECLAGRDSAFLYQQGKRNTILNDKPVQGTFNACDEGSGDHYDKAAFMIHMIRIIMDDDSAFFGMLRSMNAAYYHKIVTGREIAAFIQRYSGKDFSKVFEQYLSQAGLPVLELKYKGKKLSYRWSHCVAGFNMPVLIHAGEKNIWLRPGTSWQQLALGKIKFCIDRNFLVDSK